MSIRTVLLSAVIAVGILMSLLVASLAVKSIRRSVQHEAQQRVNHDLGIAHTLYEQELRSLADALVAEAGTLDLSAEPELLTARLQNLKHRSTLTVLNLARVEEELPTETPATAPRTQETFRDDPIIRQALEGHSAFGTILLTGERLEREGGKALRQALSVRASGAPETTATDSALFWWAACPLRDDTGDVAAILYGGRALNHRYQLVDGIQRRIFGTELHGGKPLGTVTVFLEDIRVNTNVLGPNSRRALGTRVSTEVRQCVLDARTPYYGRAWVVDAWYLSGYLPLRDPAGTVIGMLYVGLLEAPYDSLETELIRRFLVPASCLLLGALVVAIWLVRRITDPLGQLNDAAMRLADGNWEQDLPPQKSYLEITHLGDAFSRMQNAIRQRDTQLTDANGQLSTSNEKLTQTNRNYMEMLGFVTHELKSPLAAMQTIISTVTEGYCGDVPEAMNKPLTRIQRNCEELQDMVKNYLDLSRAERGELTANRRDIDFNADIVVPCVEQTTALLQSRSMTLETTCPDAVPLKADPELMRIALTNFLSNAAKYGAEDGAVRLEVAVQQDELQVSVWNEGTGFTPEESTSLFGKFSRLKNAQTREKRGSGLGLFLCKQVAEQHGGRVWAESTPGKWARFGLAFPVEGPPKADVSPRPPQ
ncbi:MAG: HAMP domain-containing protein [Lentisphaerae bacterium]|jgi:two-component system, NtrC family, sensor kinase|nr:HAMP domain-containing protein [Lentisphaerota bacterium]MBT4818905.1 HAMP domain-containing protein [Lentisphaerota bacterium]MBT5606102.1 HAMP domain-containing protein [Lentisphaerota bacterium]MBT7058550.1 HAMP domain-containing protein [Lentisphaerota bacterium]MBT7845784.1 HAMP domain-containing protein [Lentisphaerota bacterium]